MKILLTGATGFLGSHILKGLIDNNIDVIILKRSYSNDQRIAKYLSNCRSYNIDKVCTKDVFKKEIGINGIIHCATNYGRNNELPSEVVESNLVFPLSILEDAALNNVDFFINTDTFFGKKVSVEGYMQNYILSKNQFLEWGKLYARTEKIKFFNLRLEHIYGEGDDDSKFIPYLIHNLMQNIEKIDLTDGEQSRDFIYISDVVSAYLKILDESRNLDGFKEYEVGYGKATKIKDLVEMIRDITESTTMLNFGAINYKTNEIKCSQASNLELIKLGWSPKDGIASGMKKYIDNYSNK